MPKRMILMDPGLCTGCLRCQLACSEAWHGVFLPDLACVRIENTGVSCVIEFHEECRGCGLCATACLYGALKVEEAP